MCTPVETYSVKLPVIDCSEPEPDDFEAHRGVGRFAYFPVKLCGGFLNKVKEGLVAGVRVIVSQLLMRSMSTLEASGAIVCRNAKEWRD